MKYLNPFYKNIKFFLRIHGKEESLCLSLMINCN